MFVFTSTSFASRTLPFVRLFACNRFSFLSFWMCVIVRLCTRDERRSNLRWYKAHLCNHEELNSSQYTQCSPKFDYLVHFVVVRRYLPRIHQHLTICSLAFFDGWHFSLSLRFFHYYFVRCVHVVCVFWLWSLFFSSVLNKSNDIFPRHIDEGKCVWIICCGIIWKLCLGMPKMACSPLPKEFCSVSIERSVIYFNI